MAAGQVGDGVLDTRTEGPGATVVSSSRDEIALTGLTPEHAMAMFRLLGGGVLGDLATVPATQFAVLPS